MRLILKEINARPKPIRVLDVGCGRGFGPNREYSLQCLNSIRAATDDYWAIEPDDTVEPTPAIFDHFQVATMEQAHIPPASIDVAYSCMVVEHVPDPRTFLTALHRCLKPGGSYLFITPSGGHLFTKLARTLKRLHVDEWALKIGSSAILVKARPRGCREQAPTHLTGQK